MKKWKIYTFIILVFAIVAAKYVLLDYPVSEGRRVGNLTKISKKGTIFKTWEGTLDEGSGDQLTSKFSVHDDKLGQELYEYQGKEIVIYYEEHLFAFPHDTKYNVVSWEPKGSPEEIQTSQKQATAGGMGEMQADEKLLNVYGRTLFCSLLGTLYQDQELYKKVKSYVKEQNLYLYKQYDKCNE